MSAKQELIMTLYLFISDKKKIIIIKNKKNSEDKFLLVHACCGDNGAATIRSDWHMYTLEEVIKLEQISF